MSTIPTTSKRVRTPYTVVGGEKIDKKRRPPHSISMLILNRSGRLYRADIAAQLDKCGVQEIISLEGPAHSYDIESLSIKYPRIRFLLLHEETSIGEKINLGIEEAHSKRVLVIWDDIKIPQPIFSTKLLEKIDENEDLCMVPLLQDQKRETAPTIEVPAFYRRKLKLIHLLPQADRMDSLYPFDFIGIYNKERFITTGGFDITIPASHWQKLDFGFRSYMWGEKIKCNTGFQLQYLAELPMEDENLTQGYRRFFLKNLSIRFNGDTGSLPGRRFLPYWLKSGTNFMSALKEYRNVKEWIDINKFRFKQDARSITELWEIEEK